MIEQRFLRCRIPAAGIFYLFGYVHPAGVIP
jgi:hypothetical protein